MADIDVERKGGMSWLWWILGLILLALIIWWIAAAGDDEPEVAEVVEPAPVVTPTTTPEPIAQGPLCVSQVLSAPMTYIGQTLGTCQVQVVEVPTDRGFWVEENGQRIFAIIIDQPQEQPKDINPGQTVRITEAVLRDRTFLPQIPGVPLDQDTENIAEQEEFFLVVDERNINILTEGNPQPGTDPAPTAGPTRNPGS
jgi:hypothetical protein